MTWKVTNVVDERFKFVLEARAEEVPFSELCQKYGISRKTGYKWVERFRGGLSPLSLVDQSRQPKSSPLKTSAEMVTEIVRLRNLHPFWGPLKLAELLRRYKPDEETPSQRTIARVLERCGLIEARRRVRGRAPGRLKKAVVPEKPNDLWTIDFKGWWRTKDRQKCEPFTLRDDWSRFFLAAYPMNSTRGDLVQEVMTDVFRRYGLPAVIRSDNGAPFAASAGYLGLTKLSAWWLALGIQLDRIEPGHPEQNGSHERPHRDMKREVQWRPAADITLQREILETWRHEFNHVRPHQALGMKTPAEFYSPSPKKFPEGKLAVTYPANYETRKVTPSGFVSYSKRMVFVSQALAGWDVGIERGVGKTKVWFAGICLGETDTSWNERLRPVTD